MPLSAFVFRLTDGLPLKSSVIGYVLLNFQVSIQIDLLLILYFYCNTSKTYEKRKGMFTKRNRKIYSYLFPNNTYFKQVTNTGFHSLLLFGLKVIVVTVYRQIGYGGRGATSRLVAGIEWERNRWSWRLHVWSSLTSWEKVLPLRVRAVGQNKTQDLIIFDLFLIYKGQVLDILKCKYVLFVTN